MNDLTLEHGLKQLSLKRFAEIHEQCIAAIKQDVRNAVPYFLLGVVAFEHSNYAKALELFKTAEEYQPSEAYYPAYTAKTHSILRNQEAAKQAADRAVSMLTDDAHLLDSLAVVYSRAGYHEQAIPLFKRAIQLQPDQANMQYNLGASAQFVGDFELAQRSYEQAVALQPENYRAWASLVYLNKQTAGQNHIECLVGLFKHNAGDADAALQLGHAIAKSYEDMDDYTTSFHWLLKAKQGKRTELPYDKQQGAATFQAAANTSEIVSKRDALGSESGATAIDNQRVPIFIIGLPRTGTTLVDRILSSHAQVTSAGELNTFAQLVKDGANTNSKLVLDAQTLSNALTLNLTQLGRDYMCNTDALARGSDFVIDKMPLNFFYAALIHEAMPNARIIALRRGAMDSCLSNFRQLFSTQQSFYNYTYDLESTAWFYRQFDQLMNHWEATLAATRFMQISYEDIVFDQENQTRRLLNFCGLEWDSACLRFHENQAPVSTASSVQVRQPLYSGSIGRWQKYGSLVDPLQNDLADLIA